jgi:hypothetical protein
MVGAIAVSSAAGEGSVMDYQPLLDDLSLTGNLSKSCRTLGISRTQFLNEVAADRALQDRYARAREAGLDAEADRGMEEALQAEDAALGRLALDARKWYLSKLFPKKYGDKQLVGSDPDNPLPAGVSVTFKG